MCASGILNHLAKMFLSVFTIFVIIATARTLIRTAATKRAHPIQVDSESSPKIITERIYQHVKNMHSLATNLTTS